MTWRKRAGLAVLGLVAGWLTPGVAEAGNRNSACGGPLQRHCCVFEEIPACDAGRVSIIGGPGAGQGPLACSLGTCYSSTFPASCGDRYERACTLNDHYQACQSGLRSIGGFCLHPDDLFSGAGCGEENEPACTLDVQVALGISACQSFLREVPVPGNCVRLDAQGFPPSCGHEVEDACTLDVQALLGISSCASGLTEVPFLNGTCIELDADGFPDFCGDESERPCRLNEHIPSCKADLAEKEVPLQTGETTLQCADAFPEQCGRNGQRPCGLLEHIPSCKSELRELPQDFGVCGTDPESRGETDAQEKPRGGRRTVFFIHGRGGDLRDIQNNAFLQRLFFEAKNVKGIYGIDWNNAADSSPRQLKTRQLLPLDPSCVPTTSLPCAFTFAERSWDTDQFDYKTFKIPEVAQAAAEAIRELASLDNDVTLIATSFGGVIARQIVYRHYDELRAAGRNIAEVVTVGVPHRGGLAGDLSLAGGRSAELQTEFACQEVDGEQSNRTGCQVGRWIEWMKQREDGTLDSFGPWFIDDRNYPQIRWITLASNAKRLELGEIIDPLQAAVDANVLGFPNERAEEFLALARDWDNSSTAAPFPDSDGTVTVRSQWGIATDECFPFLKALPPSGRTTAEVVHTSRFYHKADEGVVEALSAVCYHQDARSDPRVVPADDDPASDDFPFPDDLLSVGHGEVLENALGRAFIIAALSLPGDTNGDGRVDDNDLQAAAGPDRTLECTGSLTEVALDASASFVPPGLTLGFTWSGPFGSASGAIATVALAVGAHAISLDVDDGAGHHSTDQVVVRVSDTTPPSVDDGIEFILEASAMEGTPFAVTANASDLCGTATVAVAPELAAYPLGTTVLTATATDQSGNLATGTLRVTVRDTTPPEITGPADVRAEANAVLSTVEIGSATATDIFPVTLSNDAPATFPLGDTTVRWTATDANGNSAGAVQRVTVVDTTPPVIAAPADLRVEANAVLSTAQIGSATATDIFSVTLSNDAPATFPLGVTTVRWMATDANGNAASAIQTVTIVDTTPPVLSLPPDVVVTAAGPLTTPVEIGTATATDIFGATVSHDAPASFTLGTTLVTWTAVDGNGNRATATQKVEVIYGFRGFAGPIQPGGTYKADRTLPLMFGLAFADGTPATSAVARLSVAPLGAGLTLAEPLEVSASDAPDQGDVFRYTGEHYHFNLSTLGWSAGAYRISVGLDDGRRYVMDISLR